MAAQELGRGIFIYSCCLAAGGRLYAATSHIASHRVFGQRRYARITYATSASIDEHVAALMLLPAWFI